MDLLKMIGQPLRRFEIVASTNDIAREWAQGGAAHGAVVTARGQTDGRGRRARSWQSAPGRGLYLSIILRPADEAPLTRWTLIVAVAVARAIEAELQAAGVLRAAQLKWPNDILLGGCKIGGILCETSSGAIIAGIGLNVNQEAAELPERPLFPASSLKLQTGRAWELEPLLERLFLELNALQAQEWDAIRAEFERRCPLWREPVRVTTETETYHGVASGLDEDGVLLVETAAGPRRVVAGDVTF
jgi:BirA family biotin operon repressor/biotin-[acetyl-CoA-carboxylase] ligase